MQKSSPKDVKKIQKLLPNNYKIENGVLWDLQDRKFESRVVRKRVFERKRRVTNWIKCTEIGGESKWEQLKWDDKWKTK